MSGATYAAAGVDITAGNRAVDLMRAAVTATHGPEVLAGVGAFGGIFDAVPLQGMKRPALVASTDGVGTKTRVATALGRYDTIGQDLVNHCINDILVQGARPLFFLDYFAASRLVPEIVADVVSGCARACQAAGCALLGGETAEMPGVYAPDELDLAGTIVGVVEQDRIIDGRAIEVGDVVLGLASTGLHTNGYSLARRVFEGMDLRGDFPALGGSLGDALLAIHRSYLPDIQRLLVGGVRGPVPVRALVHITGGGLIENPPRVLPSTVAMELRRGSWQVPPLFRLIQELGDVVDAEMARVFNMGLGMLVVVPAARAEDAQSLLAAGVQTWEVGRIVPRTDRAVELVGRSW